MVRKIKSAMQNADKGMMKTANNLKGEIANIQEKLNQKEFNISVGGGAVKVKINGKKQIFDLSIDDELLCKDEAETLKELVILAINEAISKVEEESEKEMAMIASNFSLPGLF